MSIYNALKETAHQSQNILDLAKLPQAMIMQMAQNGEIQKDMVMPILGKKAEMVEAAAKMKAAAALAAQGGHQPTVMEKYMGQIAAADHPMPQQMPQAPQMEQQQQMPPQMSQQQPAPQMPPQMAQQPMPQGPEDVGIASQATAPMGLAGGGIIAFEDGGDVNSDEDYQEMMDDAHESAMNEKLYEMISGLKGGHGVGIATGHRGAERGVEGNLEARLRSAIMSKESGGQRYDKNGNLLTSSKGALGEMQVMPGTAKDPGFGIKPAQSNHPDELRRVGDEYSNMLLNRYRDPKLAMIAYNMGPGATDKWLASGADLRKLPKETQGYIQSVNLAGGGQVQHYAEGDYVGFGEEIPYDESQSMGLRDWWKRNSPGSKEFIAAQEEEKKKAVPVKTVAAPVQTPVQTPPPQLNSQFDNVPGLEKNRQDQDFDMMGYIKSREAKMDEAAKQDKWQAALAAGLGMLGGTSQYAWENIGKGGQMGVQQLASSQKTRAAQEAAMGKLYGSAAQTDLMSKLRRDQLTQGKELKEEQLSQNLQVAKNNYIQKRLKEHGMDEMMLGNLRKQKDMGKLDPAKVPELNYYEKQMQDIENEANRMFTSPGSGSGFSARRIG